MPLDGPPMNELVIIADDLSGAADCAVMCAAAGLDALVALDGHAPLPRGCDGVAVLAIDADTRGRTRAEAELEIGALVRRHAPHGRPLFRKLDSTLRGHVAAELAATLAVRREAGPSVIALAPAFPATGRTTLGGHQHVGGERLEHTELWRRENIPGEAWIPGMLAAAGLRSAVLPLHDVRGPSLARSVRAAAEAHDVLVFDAEQDRDLRAAAGALSCLQLDVVWAGSAGLAAHLPQVARATGDVSPPFVPPVVGRPVLVVLGSASSVSRAQARVLAGEPGLETVAVPVAALHAGPGSEDWNRAAAALVRGIARGRDVLLLLGADEPVDLAQGHALAGRLARLVQPAAPLIGGLVATGGETARAVLLGFGTSALRLIGEIEPGVPCSLALGGPAMPVITKAGGFGDPETLRRCLRLLRGAGQISAPA